MFILPSNEEPQVPLQAIVSASRSRSSNVEVREQRRGGGCGGNDRQEGDGAKIGMGWDAVASDLRMLDDRNLLFFARDE